MPVLRNIRRERFAQAVATGSHATLAAAHIVAGYKGDPGQAAKLRWEPEVAQRIDELQREGAERALVTIEEVILELRKVAFSNMADFMTGDGNGGIFTDLSDLTRDQAAALSEVTSETSTARGEDGVTTRKIKFKLHDKLAGLDKIGRYLGMFKEKLELTGPNGGPVQTINATMTPREAAELYARTLNGNA